MGIFGRAVEAAQAAKEKILRLVNPKPVVTLGVMNRDGQLFPATTGPVMVLKACYSASQAAAAAVTLIPDIAALIAQEYPWFTRNHLENCTIRLNANPDGASDFALDDDFELILCDSTGAAQIYYRFLLDMGQINMKTGHGSEWVEMTPGALGYRLDTDAIDWAAAETHIYSVGIEVLYYPTRGLNL